MATGDQADMARRVLALTPTGWFGDTFPILSALLQGAGAVLAKVYTAIQYVQLQTRIATATDYNLDIIGKDFFGTGLERNTGESDTAYRARIQAALFRPAATRSAVQQAAESVTGNPVTVFEPNNVRDAGGYDVGTFAYDTAGGYGSMLMPQQAFITAPRSGSTTQQQVYAAINGARPAASIMWTKT